MFRNKFRAPYLFAALFSACVGLGASAGTLDVMAIGDSLTWGYIKQNPDGSPSSTSQSNGGWRAPLEVNLNTSPLLSDSFSFIGVKGDNNPNTVAQEEDDDSFDGPNSTVSLHEGYSGWVINDSNRTASHIANFPGRQSISGNLTSNGGAIAPQNADVVMLMVGINDILGISFPGSSAHATVDPMVVTLGQLIDDIVGLAPDATILVSTLLPVREGQTIGSDSSATLNGRIDDFNEQVLEDFFGDQWFDDSFATETHAEHDTHDNVFLVNAHSAIDPGAAAGDITNDDLHLTVAGYQALGDYYADRFVTLVPTPSTAAMLLVLGGLALRRGRRAA